MSEDDKQDLLDLCSKIVGVVKHEPASVVLSSLGCCYASALQSLVIAGSLPMDAAKILAVKMYQTVINQLDQT